MFPNKFGFQNKKVQTADINPLLLKISSINKGFGGNKKRDNLNIKNLSRSVTSTGLQTPQNNRSVKSNIFSKDAFKINNNNTVNRQQKVY